MKKCAYCNQFKRLTREHLIPAWVPREQPTSNVRFDLNQERVSERVPTIRDVCSDCNNGPLSMYRGPESVAPKNISVTRLFKILPDGLNLLMGRAVQINSYCFAIITLPGELPRQSRRRLMTELTNEFVKKFGHLQTVDPRFKKMRLMIGDVDLIEMKKIAS